MDNKPTTQSKRPSPLRPPYGFIAWQMTLGYICNHRSPDAVLKLEAYPSAEEGVLWAASASWGRAEESVRDKTSIAAALGNLWQEVDRNHIVFGTPEDAVRRPSGYEDHEWLDANTADILQRLILTAQTGLKKDWLLVIIYQPTEAPVTRVQGRLLAQDNRAAGQGGSLIEALRELFRNATPLFANVTDEDNNE